MTSPDSLLGKALAGVYILEEVIATGSTSIIFRATNRRLDQQVAVKVLFGSFTSNASLMGRFEAEARVQAKLNHPHIIRVFDFVADDGIYAIVMEFAEGVALDQILYDLGAPMDLRRIKELLRPILDAVGYAHGHGIVHRDIKPSNIIVTRVGRAEFPKVMDFGIAKVVAEGPSNTAPGAMLGTLLFMSPEQCKALKSVDERADIYSLGVTIYQMATGMVPFYAESAFEIMLAHVQTPPTPPREFVPNLPEAMEELILRTLAKDPEQRFRTVGELLDALEAVPDGSDELIGVAHPPTVKPDVARSEVARPEAARPEVARSEVARPEVARPEVARPEVARPEVARPPGSATQPPLLRAQPSDNGGRRPRLLARDKATAPPMDAAIGSPSRELRDTLRRRHTGPEQRAPGERSPERPPRRGPRETPPREDLDRAAKGAAQKEDWPLRSAPASSRDVVSSRPWPHDTRASEEDEKKPSRMVERPFMTRRSRPTPNPSPPTRSRRPTAPRGVRSRAAGPLVESHTEVLGLSAYMAQATRLRLRVPSKDDWSRYFDPNIAGGGIFCPTAEPPDVGAPVRVEITFVGGPRFFVRGAVTWRRPKLNDPRARAGVGVQVHSSERNKISYVHSWVHGDADDKRGLRRLPLKLRVTYTGRSGRRINFTRDLNEEGIFVRSRELLELDTTVQLLLMPPGNHKPIPLSGVVSRLVADGEDRGMGIRLRFRDTAAETRYAGFIEELEHQFLSGLLSDEVLA